MNDEIMLTLTDYAIGVVFYTLEHFKFYRRWRGGRWEKWWIGPPVASSMWFHNDKSPPPMGLMLDAVEDYRPAEEPLPCAGPYRTLGDSRNIDK